MKYLWQEADGDELHGPFYSIEGAVRDAHEALENCGEPRKIEIYDTRPATPADDDLFNDVDGVDVTAPNWWVDLVVPENLAKAETVFAA